MLKRSRCGLVFLQKFIFPVQLADREQDWQLCPVVMVIHINKLYIHTAVVTHICIYSSEPCTNVHVPPPKKILVPGIQTNTNSSAVPVHIHVLTTDTGVDHEQVWQYT